MDNLKIRGRLDKLNENPEKTDDINKEIQTKQAEIDSIKQKIKDYNDDFDSDFEEDEIGKITKNSEKPKPSKDFYIVIILLTLLLLTHILELVIVNKIDEKNINKKYYNTLLTNIIGFKLVFTITLCVVFILIFPPTIILKSFQLNVFDILLKKLY